MLRVRGAAFSIVAFGLTVVARAAAQEPPRDTGPSTFPSGEPKPEEATEWTAELRLGVGGGNMGSSTDAVLSVQRWLGPELGFGLELALVEPVLMLGGAAAVAAIPHFAYRSDDVQSTWLFSAGLG